MRSRGLMTRRSFAKELAAGTGAAFAPAVIVGQGASSVVTTGKPDDSANTRDVQSSAPVRAGDKLQSEFLFDLVFDKGMASNVGSPGVNRVVVPVTGGTFEGPKLKGTVIGPSGDSIVVRPDGSSVLDLRLLLETHDSQKIYMTCRGIAYTPPGRALFARLLPMFETGAVKYAWLNNVVAVGVYRPTPAKVAYRIYRIL